jgi:hypothetical protein
VAFVAERKNRLGPALHGDMHRVHGVFEPHFWIIGKNGFSKRRNVQAPVEARCDAPPQIAVAVLAKAFALSRVC